MALTHSSLPASLFQRTRQGVSSLYPYLSNNTQYVHSKPYLSILAIPVYAAAASLLVLSLQTAHSLFKGHKTDSSDASEPPRTLVGRFKKHVDSLGGWVILGWRITRLLALVALVALSSLTVMLVHHHHKAQHGIKDPKLPYFGLVVVYVCDSALTSHRPTYPTSGLFHPSSARYCHRKVFFRCQGRKTSLPRPRRRLGCLCLP